jgi:predicted lipid-binding transport protein (Tim44 family)
MKYISSLLIIILLTSCSYRPIFAPNQKFKNVGEQKANQDAEQCSEEADKYLKASNKRRAAKEGARGAGIGAIFGAAWGLLTGDRTAILKSVAIGAGVGGAVKGGGVLAEDKLTPSQIKQRYVSMCLGSKGYSILGWE